MSTIGTITLIPTRTVRQVVIGSTFMTLPEGTTDVNAVDVVRPYVPGKMWTYIFVGPEANSTLIVAVVRRTSRDESITEAFARAEARAKKMGEKFLSQTT